MKVKIIYKLIGLLILNIAISIPPFIFAEETPTIAIEKAKFAIEQARQVGAEKSAPQDMAAARTWLASAQKQYEEVRSSGGWMSTEKARRIKEEAVIYSAVMARLRALTAENRAKKEGLVKKLQTALKELKEHQDQLDLRKRNLAEAIKDQEFQARIEVEKRALEELKRQITTMEQEKKLVRAEALNKVREFELLKQKELDEVLFKEKQKAAEREKELGEVKFKAEELAREKAKEEAEKKALLEKLTHLQEKAASERSMLLAAHKISGITTKLTEKEITLSILAIKLFTPAMEIRAAGKEILDQVGNFLNAYKDFPVIVRGHTDSVGHPALNQTLSEKRAQKVREYLVANQNIPPTRITAEGWGSTQPVTDNDTEFGRTLNRRVDIVIITGQ